MRFRLDPPMKFGHKIAAIDDPDLGSVKPEPVGEDDALQCRVEHRAETAKTED